MTSIIEGLIRLRNPNFSFAPSIEARTLYSFIWIQMWSMLRGWKLLFLGKNPKMALLGRNTRFFNSHKFDYGKFMKLGDGVYISALGEEGVKFGNSVGIGAYSRIVVSTSLDNPGKGIRIGNNVGIGEFAYIGGAGGVEIGDECIVGQYLSCHPENHIAEELDVSIRHQGVTRKGIKVGKNCWIGSKVTILDGVEVGDGCIIAAGAVVTKSFPANAVIGGVPAKLLKMRS
jgi:acetyltransferase-like isoleucine patch superfamily enzyme